MKYLIIYHKEDNDGLFSMAIIYNYLINELKTNKNDIDLFGADYNDTALIEINTLQEHYENIIMTDISFSDYTKMIELYNIFGNKFVWIDHHAPIINESKKQGFDSIQGWRDISRSAILNAYRYFYDQLDEEYITKKLPEYLRILSAWDSFSYEHEGYGLDFVRNVNIGTNIKYQLNCEKIINCVYNIIYKEQAVYKGSTFVNKLEEIGKLINEAKDIENESIIKNSGDLSWTVNDRAACAIFMQGPSNSLMFKSLINDNVTKNGIVFKRNSNGTWTISLYNVSTDYDKEFHCGNYMKANYNGGGHAGASGCQVTEDKFIELLKTHKL